MSGNPSDGHLHLQKYNWLERLDADKALAMLTRFAETAALWRRLKDEPSGEGLRDASSPPHGGPYGFMQV